MADGKGFDLGAMLAGLTDVSDLDTNREQITYISLTLIDSDPNNFYQLSGIEELAANIATCGLQQPIRVRKHPEAEGRYMIVSGHRRCAALALLCEDDTDRWSDVPCIVERDDISPELQELRLIYANAHTRRLTASELSNQAVKVEELLYKLKEQGYPFPGRMRDNVAKAVGVNTTKLANLKVIRENLDKCWMPEFQSGKISESVALALARLPENYQWIIFRNWRSKPEKLCHDHVTNAAKKFKALENKKCDRDCRVTCWANQARMDHIAGMGMYDRECSGCCWTCSQLKDCQWCCVVAEPQKKHLKEQAKSKKAEAKAEAQKRIQPIVDYTRGVYARWNQAKKAANLDTAQYLTACNAGPYNDRAYFDKYGTHPEKINAENIKLPFAVNIWPDEGQALCRAADVLGCSIDYLLGRTEDLTPIGYGMSGLWHYAETETPAKAGNFVCLVMVRGRKIIPTSMDFDGEAWLYMGAPISDTDVDLLYWTEFPEEGKMYV